MSFQPGRSQQVDLVTEVFNFLLEVQSNIFNTNYLELKGSPEQDIAEIERILNRVIR